MPGSDGDTDNESVFIITVDETHEFGRCALPSAIWCSIAAKPDMLCTESLAVYMPGCFALLANSTNP